MESVQISSELKVGHATHEGMSGKHNEDYYGVFGWQMDGQRKLYLGVVADGVGGQTAGEVASHLAVNTVESYFKQLQSVEDISKHLEEAILAANKAVYNASQENPELRGMSTTMAVVAVKGDRLYTAHVGDSRIYLLRDGQLRQISTDHTWAQEAIEAGLLTREQAKTHPNRNVIRRHLGGQLEVEVDHRLVLRPGQSADKAVANQGTQVRPGDTFLICSDGLTDMISDDSVFDSLRTHYFDLKTAANELVDKANRAGGKDNITLVLMQIPGGSAPTPIVSARESAAAAAAAAVSAEAKPAAAAAAKATQAPAQVAEPKKRSIGLFVIGGLFLAVAAVAVVVVLVVVSGSLGGDNSTPAPSLEPTTVPVVAPATDEPTATAGAPATVPVLSTEEGAVATETGEPTSTSPALIPTLKSTNTPTNTPVPPTRTPTPTPTETPQPTSPPGGGNGGNGGNGGGKPPPPPPPG